MNAQYASSPWPLNSNAPVPPAAAGLAGDRKTATLMVDGAGRIRGCGAAAEYIFGASQGRLTGRRISEFISDLIIFEASSPSVSAEYLAHLCGDGEWRRFEALDVCGRSFPVEINVSRRVADGEEAFVVNLRQPGDGSY